MPSRAALKLMEAYEATNWLPDQGKADISTTFAVNRGGNKAAPFALSLGSDALPFVLRDLKDLQTGAFHNIDQEDVLSVLDFQGHLFLGSVSLSIPCENAAATFESAALSLSDALGLSRACSFMCFLDYFHGIKQAKCVMNALSACSPAVCHRDFGLRNSGGTAEIYRFTVLGISPIA